jgi:cation diffusion facilitator family transporter
MTLTKKATFIATLTAGLLTIIKLFVGILSGSVAVLASAIDSILDMFVSLFNMFAVHNAEKPADSKFNYGRGKIEALAAVIEGTIIAISGLYIFYQSVKKAIYGEVSEHLDIAIIVMIISFVVTLLLVIYLNYVAKKTNNMVIKSDALHYKTDLYTNGAVLLSLVIINYTGFDIIDSLIGGGIAIFIIYSAYELIDEGISILLDRAVDEEIVNGIKQSIQSQEKITSYHWLKTREAGDNIFVEVHLVFNCLISLLEAHKVSDQIEAEMKQLDTSKKWVINIHLDPYDDSKPNQKNYCENCDMSKV